MYVITEGFYIGMVVDILETGSCTPLNPENILVQDMDTNTNVRYYIHKDILESLEDVIKRGWIPTWLYWDKKWAKYSLEHTQIIEEAYKSKNTTCIIEHSNGTTSKICFKRWLPYDKPLYCSYSGIEIEKLKQDKAILRLYLDPSVNY